MNVIGYLKSKHMRVGEVAALCGVSKQAVYNWSYAKNIPDHQARLIQFYIAASPETRLACGANIFKEPAASQRATGYAWPTFNSPDDLWLYVAKIMDDELETLDIYYKTHGFSAAPPASTVPQEVRDVYNRLRVKYEA